MKVDFSFLAFRWPGAPVPAFIGALQAAGLDVDVIEDRGAYDFGMAQRFQQILDRRKPDIVQTHSVKPHFLMRMSGARKRHVWLPFHHGYTAENIKMRAYNQLDRWSLRPARTIVTVCRPFAAELEAYGISADRIRIVPNAVEPAQQPDAAAIAEAAKVIGRRSGERVVLSVGRLSSEKGQGYLLEAAAALPSKKHLRLVFLGDGVDRGFLVAKAEALGLASSVVFAGHRSAVMPYLMQADLFASPSLSEGSPNAVLEAMAAGIPVVSTAVGGVPEMIDDGVDGLLVPAQQPTLFGQAMERILSEPGLGQKLKENAARRVNRDFTPAKHEQNLLAIYQDSLLQRL